MMRIVFMGTPDFAVASLKALAEQGTDEIVGVFTQPDRPKGRGQKMLMTPVKEYALERGYEVYQPQRVKTPEVIELLRGLAPDLIVVAAFGQFFAERNSGNAEVRLHKRACFAFCLNTAGLHRYIM